MTTSGVQQTPRDPTTHNATTEPAAPIDRPPVVPPARTGQSWTWFLYLLGFVLAIGGGMAMIYAFHTFWWNAEGVPIFPDWLALAAIPGSVVLAMAAAALLRSWWAVLIVPIAFFIGGQLALLIAGGFDVRQWSGAFLTVSFSVLVFTLPPAIVGVAIGAPIGKWVARRRHG